MLINEDDGYLSSLVMCATRATRSTCSRRTEQKTKILVNKYSNSYNLNMSEKQSSSSSAAATAPSSKQVAEEPQSGMRSLFTHNLLL